MRIPRKIKIRAGKLSLNIENDKDLSSLIKKACEIFEKNKIFSDEINYSIKFKKISKSDITLAQPDAKYKNIIQDYNKYFFKNLTENADDIGFSYLTLLFLKSPLFINYLRRNHKRLKKDFFICVFRDHYLLLIDTKRKSSTVFYGDFKNLKHTVNTLRNCINYHFFMLLPQINSFILHCSAVKINGKGTLFIGEGGSGKSTIAKILMSSGHNTKILSDDMITVQDSKNASSFYAGKVRQDNKPIEIKKTDRIKKMKIDRIFMISKSKRNRIKSHDRFDTLKEILCLHLLNRNLLLNSTKKITEMIIRFIDRYPPRTLYFKKDKSFIDLLLKD